MYPNVQGEGGVLALPVLGAPLPGRAQGGRCGAHVALSTGTVYCTLHSAQCTVHTAQCTLHTVYFAQENLEYVTESGEEEAGHFAISPMRLPPDVSYLVLIIIVISSATKLVP